MSANTPNPLPHFEDETGFYAPAPLHVVDLTTRACVYCGAQNIWDTYPEYEEFWWTHEYEGEPGHRPSDEADFDMNASLCLAVAA